MKQASLLAADNGEILYRFATKNMLNNDLERSDTITQPHNLRFAGILAGTEFATRFFASLAGFG